MKIQIINSDKLEFLKDRACLTKCLNKYQNYTSNEWISEVCDGNPFIDTKFVNVRDFELDMSAEKSKAFETELENVKRVYRNLKFLTESMATDERLWSALCLGPFFEYVHYRWNIKSESSVEQHYFFDPHSSGRRVLTRNALSRLWWIGRLTYDEDRDDKWELTRFVCSHSDYIMHFIERNTSNNIHVLRPFLEAIMDAQKNGYNINTDDAGNIAKYLNLLGGMYVLDFMSEEWIKEKIISKISAMFMKPYQEAEKEIASSLDDASMKVEIMSKVVLKNEKTNQKILVPARKNKFITKPESLVGLCIGDKVSIGKMHFLISDIR